MNYTGLLQVRDRPRYTVKCNRYKDLVSVGSPQREMIRVLKFALSQ